MASMNVHDAKTHFSQLLARVEAGEEIIIARAGKPIARLVPVASESVTRVPGTYKGSIVLADDFDADLPDAMLDAFEGGGER